MSSRACLYILISALSPCPRFPCPLQHPGVPLPNPVPLFSRLTLKAWVGNLVFFKTLLVRCVLCFEMIWAPHILGTSQGLAQVSKWDYDPDSKESHGKGERISSRWHRGWSGFGIFAEGGEGWWSLQHDYAIRRVCPIPCGMEAFIFNTAVWHLRLLFRNIHQSCWQIWDSARPHLVLAKGNPLKASFVLHFHRLSPLHYHFCRDFTRWSQPYFGSRPRLRHGLCAFLALWWSSFFWFNEG